MAKGEITVARINASAERVLRAKAALGLSVKRAIDLREVDSVMSNPRFNETAQQIADRFSARRRFDFERAHPSLEASSVLAFDVDESSALPLSERELGEPRVDVRHDRPTACDCLGDVACTR